MFVMRFGKDGKNLCFNVTTPLKAWNGGTHRWRGCIDHGFNVTTPLKAWNVASKPWTANQVSCFNVTTPLKAWNDFVGNPVQRQEIMLQCDHAVEGVE